VIHSKRILTLALKDRIEASSIRSDRLLAEASEIVIFGSRSAGVESCGSDLDVLCVGEGGRVKNRFLDLLWVSEDRILTSAWLGSELATHIAEFGIPLKGGADWRYSVSFSQRAKDRKANRIRSLVRHLCSKWQALHPMFRLRYRTTIRREFQRYECLLRSVPIPPTPILDMCWQRHSKDLLLLASQQFPEVLPTVRWALFPCDGAVLGHETLPSSRTLDT
jgi:predicted nucleotidyltransferase